MSSSISYKDSGVDVKEADELKRGLVDSLRTSNSRVLNQVGAFASLFDGRFPEYQHPILVLKTEEPGTKQKIAFQNSRIRSICFDMINHLVNDIVVMGAKPLAVQDAIICGKLEKDTVKEIVDSIAEACRAQECVLTGGETSEQPGVIEPGLYILTSSILGVVEKSEILDGSSISKGDLVISLPSSGVHTNGYSLIRALIKRNPKLVDVNVNGRTFLEEILEPHRCYYGALKPLLVGAGIHGLAHITGGGIAGNLNRILPKNCSAVIDLSSYKIPEVFHIIRREGGISNDEMLRTYNLGVGIAAVVSEQEADKVIRKLSNSDWKSYIVGRIEEGSGDVRFENSLAFS